MDDELMNKKALLQRLENETQVLKTPAFKKAFETVDRADFVPEDYKVEAYEDYALPIGFGQTISQPTTVAFMLELLNPQPGNSVLDIGAGSGYATTLLGKLVGEEGKIYATEIIPELVETAKANIKKYDLENVEIEQATKELGIPREGPFDRILVSAAAERIPAGLIDQLASPGVLVIPVLHSIYRIEKDEDGELSEQEYPGFEFVPLQN